MKELSIEEKAKAYDEAIKRAQAKMEEAKVFDYDDEQTAHTIRLTTTDIFPELSESEDDRIRKDIVEAVELHKDFTQGRKEHIYAWLEKQKGTEREIEGNSLCNGEQKPAWSEEDERILKRVIDFIPQCMTAQGYNEYINWFKALKERVQLQSTWKPSDEQINALNYVVNLMASSERPTENDLYYNILKSLRQQLKKLK